MIIGGVIEDIKKEGHYTYKLGIRTDVYAQDPKGSIVITGHDFVFIPVPYSYAKVCHVGQSISLELKLGIESSAS